MPMLLSCPYHDQLSFPSCSAMARPRRGGVVHTEFSEDRSLGPSRSSSLTPMYSSVRSCGTMSVKCLSVIRSSISVSRLRSRVSSLMWSRSCPDVMLVVASASCVAGIILFVFLRYLDSSCFTAFCPFPRVPLAPSTCVVTRRTASFSVD